MRLCESVDILNIGGYSFSPKYTRNPLRAVVFESAETESAFDPDIAASSGRILYGVGQSFVPVVLELMIWPLPLR
jgi:hypothetical protein